MGGASRQTVATSRTWDYMESWACYREFLCNPLTSNFQLSRTQQASGGEPQSKYPKPRCGNQSQTCHGWRFTKGAGAPKINNKFLEGVRHFESGSFKTIIRFAARGRAGTSMGTFPGLHLKLDKGPFSGFSREEPRQLTQGSASPPQRGADFNEMFIRLGFR